jgi:hypothetical protein
VWLRTEGSAQLFARSIHRDWWRLTNGCSEGPFTFLSFVSCAPRPPSNPVCLPVAPSIFPPLPAPRKSRTPSVFTCRTPTLPRFSELVERGGRGAELSSLHSLPLMSDSFAGYARALRKPGAYIREPRSQVNEHPVLHPFHAIPPHAALFPGLRFG